MHSSIQLFNGKYLFMFLSIMEDGISKFMLNSDFSVRIDSTIKSNSRDEEIEWVEYKFNKLMLHKYSYSLWIKYKRVYG
jgi:hypothetical protein